MEETIQYLPIPTVNEDMQFPGDREPKGTGQGLSRDLWVSLGPGGAPRRHVSSQTQRSHPQALTQSWTRTLGARG